eukprot:scpid103221/ scgid4715/ 
MQCGMFSWLPYRDCEQEIYDLIRHYPTSDLYDGLQERVRPSNINSRLERQSTWTDNSSASGGPHFLSGTRNQSVRKSTRSRVSVQPATRPANRLELCSDMTKPYSTVLYEDASFEPHMDSISAYSLYSHWGEDHDIIRASASATVSMTSSGKHTHTVFA